MNDLLQEEWWWDYVQPNSMPGFYMIKDEEDNTIAHIELERHWVYDRVVELMCENYNRLKMDENKKSTWINLWKLTLEDKSTDPNE